MNAIIKTNLKTKKMFSFARENRVDVQCRCDFEAVLDDDGYAELIEDVCLYIGGQFITLSGFKDSKGRTIADLLTEEHGEPIKKVVDEGIEDEKAFRAFLERTK